MRCLYAIPSLYIHASTCKCLETYLEAHTHPLHDIAYFCGGRDFFYVRSACMTFCLTKYDPSAFSRFTMIFVEPVRQVIVLQVIHVAHIIFYSMENRLPIEYLSLHQLLAINDHQEEAKYVDVELMKHGCDPISQRHSWDMKIRTDLQQH